MRIAGELRHRRVGAGCGRGRRGTRRAWAEEIVREQALVAPHLILVEGANVLRRLERARRLTPSDSASALRDLFRLDIELVPFHPFADRVWALRDVLTS